MLNIVFDELTAKVLIKTAFSEKVVCLGNTLDIGPIFDEEQLLAREEYFTRMAERTDYAYSTDYWQKLWDDYNTVKNALSQGENIRVWHCGMAFSVCGLALLCYMARGGKSRFYLLQCPKDIGKASDSYVPPFPYIHWALMKPEKCISFVGKEVPLSVEKRVYYSSLWEKLMRENTNLRILKGEDIISVKDEYFDNVILEITNETLRDDNMRYARALEKTGEYINQMWFLDRMRSF